MNTTTAKKDFFLISPVRNAPLEVKERVRHYVASMRQQGMIIHYPEEDTTQEDPVGVDILTTNKIAIINARHVRIFYYKGSEGSIFDLGMTFMSGKDLYLVNPEDTSYDGTIYTQFIYGYAQGLEDDRAQGLEELLTPQQRKEVRHLMTRLKKRQQEITMLTAIGYSFTGRTPEFLLDFGMAFMSGKPIYLKNRLAVEKLRTPHKSFENVLLALDDYYHKHWSPFPKA